MCFHPLKCDWTFRNTPQITVIMKTMGLIPNFQKADVFLLGKGCRDPRTFSGDLSCDQEQV